MAVTARKQFRDSVDDWNVLSGMSPHLRAALTRRGITTYELALKCSSDMGKLLEMKSYALNGFAVYTCLLDVVRP